MNFQIGEYNLYNLVFRDELYTPEKQDTDGSFPPFEKPDHIIPSITQFSDTPDQYMPLFDSLVIIGMGDHRTCEKPHLNKCAGLDHAVPCYHKNTYNL